MTAPVILFVDDDPNLLAGIRRSLRGLSEQWSMLFAGDGRQALDILASQPVNVVVTDIAMPGMDGHALIRYLYDCFPNLAVVILSGHWSAATSQRQVGGGIRFLSKPVSAEALAATINLALQDACLAGPEEILPEDPLRHRYGTPEEDWVTATSS